MQASCFNCRYQIHIFGSIQETVKQLSGGEMIQLLDVIAIVAAGLMVGNELSIAVFVHPSFDRLPDSAHLPSATAVARLLGRVMPFWYGLVLALILSDAFARWRASGQIPRLIAVSSLLWVVSIAYTIAALVPINNRIASWTQSNLPADWKSYRRRWDLLHRWRVVLLLAAFTTLVIGIQRSSF